MIGLLSRLNSHVLLVKFLIIQAFSHSWFCSIKSVNEDNCTKMVVDSERFNNLCISHFLRQSELISPTEEKQATEDRRLTDQDFNILLVDVYNAKNISLLAGVSLPPHSCTPHISLAPMTPFPFPFKRPPCRLTICGLIAQSGP